MTNVCLEWKAYLNNMNVKQNFYIHWRNLRVASKQRGYLYICMHTFLRYTSLALELSIIKTLLNPWAHVQAFGPVSMQVLFVWTCWAHSESPVLNQLLFGEKNGLLSGIYPRKSWESEHC